MVNSLLFTWRVVWLPLFQVGSQGKAVGIDHIEEIVADSIKNVNKDKPSLALLESGQMKLIFGDGREGYAPEAPYDAIHVGAAAKEIPEEVSVKERELILERFPL